MRIGLKAMAQQWRKQICALLIGALREKLMRNHARIGYSLKEHQCAAHAARRRDRRVRPRLS